MSDTATRLRARAEISGITLPRQIEALVAYFDLLFRWNSKINLTSLTDPDKAIDRLLLEPVVAAMELPRHGALIDLGSGGGSPGIPLAIMLETRRLVMVESKVRKAAFLREASRTAGLNAVVESGRFEEVAQAGLYGGQMSIVSIRAVRVDRQTLMIADEFLAPGGIVALFSSSETPPAELPPNLRLMRVAPLPGPSHLILLSR